MYFQVPGEVNKEVALPAIKTVETIKSVSYYLIVYNICLVFFPFSHFNVLFINHVITWSCYFMYYVI